MNNLTITKKEERLIPSFVRIRRVLPNSWDLEKMEEKELESELEKSKEAPQLTPTSFNNSNVNNSRMDA